MTRIQIEATIAQLHVDREALEVPKETAKATYLSFTNLGRGLTRNEIDGQNLAALELHRLYSAIANVEMQIGSWYMILSRLP
jgi:predicted metalloenzyme YecM